MSISGDLVYSNDAFSAFLAAIVHSFQEQHPDGYLGRTAIQKLSYFAKALGVPIPCRFGIYTYGPYSDAVTFSVESLLADEVVVDRSSKPDYSNYRMGPIGDELLRRFDDEVRPHLPTINRVVHALGKFKPAELELIATLHFIALRLRQVQQTEPQKLEVIREFKSVKGEKFTKEEIGAWYDSLRQAGLI